MSMVADTELIIAHLIPATRFIPWCRMSEAQSNKRILFFKQKQTYF